MKRTLFFLLCSISYCLHAQIKDIDNYQQQINKAELKLIDGNTKAAFEIYATTLKKADGYFSKDVYNSLLLAKELSKKEEFFQLLHLLKKKGLSNSYLKELEVFKEFHADKRWQTFLEANENRTGINATLKASIDSLHIVDQFFRTQEGSYKVYGDTIKQIDSLNMAYLINLIAQNKFPGEDEIGVNTIFGVKGYDIVLHHYTQATSQDKKLPKISSILIDLVRQGKILPNKCAHWLEMQNGEFKAGVFDITGFKVNGKHAGYFKARYNTLSKLMIDKNRKLLHLESLEDYYKKVSFIINNPETKYNFDVPLSIFNVDEKMFTTWSSSMTEIK